jgi:hypothetical protein
VGREFLGVKLCGVGDQLDMVPAQDGRVCRVPGERDLHEVFGGQMAARGIARFAIAAYLNVPVYAAFHDWLGRGDDLRPMWDAWQAGDRKAALAAIPDEVVDQLVIHGPPEACREHIDRYHANGVTTSALALMGPAGGDNMQALRDLAPAARR